MKKRILLVFMISMFIMSLFSKAFALNVEEIKALPTLLQMKDLIQDINQMPTFKYGSINLTSDPSEKSVIEWIVLDRNETTAILVSKKVLDKSQYSDQNSEIVMGEIMYKWLSQLKFKAFDAVDFKKIVNYTLLTKSDIDKYFTQADGNKRLAIAEYGRNEGQTMDYWLANEVKSRSGMYFSSYGNYFTGHFGETFGVRPVIYVNIADN
jgi:hypothetical protein